MANPSDFQEYMYNDFLKDLEENATNSFEQLKHKTPNHPVPADCPHHNVPTDLAFPVTWFILGTWSHKFVSGLYTTTMLHEAIHASCPEKESDWLRYFGRHHIPMIPLGWGCFRPAYPCILLFSRQGRERDIPLDLWDGVCNYLVEDVSQILQEINIAPKHFFEQVVSDVDFNRFPNRYEELLQKRLTEKWGLRCKPN